MLTNHEKRVICRYLTNKIGQCIYCSALPFLDFKYSEGKAVINDKYRVGVVSERLDKYTSDLIQNIKHYDFVRPSLNNNKKSMIEVITIFTSRYTGRDYFIERNILRIVVNWKDVWDYSIGYKHEGGKTELKNRIQSILDNF